jgi:hypothetical protein
MHKEMVAHYRNGSASEADMREMDDLCLLKEGESPKEESPETGQEDLAEVLVDDT